MNNNGISDSEKQIISAIEEAIVFNETGKVVKKNRYREDMPNLDDMYIGELLDVAEEIGVEITTKMSIQEIKERLKIEYLINP